MKDVRRIHQLSAIVANQIAAGEVIERPASVVKELLENALDAQADTIHIEIGAGGLNHIKVSDNGLGIMAADLPLAIAAHATSKMTQLSDLSEITSMGFRGEALASIASISRLSVCSRSIYEAQATLLKVEQSKIILLPCARNQGTTIEVRDLFFNAPVRKKFLKSERLEFLAIEAVVKRFALSAPHIAFNLGHNEKTILVLPAVVCEKTRLIRIQKLMGKAFVDASVFLDVERAGMRLEGFLSSPSYMRSQNDKQWIYLNQRMVKDKLLQHAIRQAYEDLIYPGRHPACLLYLTMPPHEVDVNVHPTKHEVRFEQPRLVHDFITSQLTQTLVISKSDVMPSANKSTIPTPLTHGKSTQETSFISSSEWLALNQQFVIMRYQGQAYLVNVARLQLLHTMSIFKQQEFPLMARPLLLPVVCAACPLDVALLTRYSSTLLTFGMKIAMQNDEQYKILSIPSLFPALDLHLFLKKLLDFLRSDGLHGPVSSSNHFTQDEIAIHCMDGEKSDRLSIFFLLASAQFVDVSQMEAAEQATMRDFAIQLWSTTSVRNDWFMVLDTNTCHRLLSPDAESIDIDSITRASKSVNT